MIAATITGVGMTEKGEPILDGGAEAQILRAIAGRIEEGSR